MRNTLILSTLLTLLLSIVACNDNKEVVKNTTIQVSEMHEVDTMILSEIHPQEAIAIDTQLIVNGKGKFNFDIEHPGFYSVIYNNKTATTLFVEKGNSITIKKDTANNGISFDIQGSSSSRDIEELFKLQNTYARSQQHIAKNAQGASESKIDTLRQLIFGLDKEFKKSIIRFIDEKPSSPATLLALFQGTGQQMIFDLYLDYPIFARVHDSLQANYPKFDAHLKFFKENLDRTIAKNFMLPDVNGNVVQFEDYKGKWILLDFWASWCKPCRDVNPKLVELHKMYEDLQMISVSLDGLPNQKDAKSEWLKAIKNDGLNDNWVHLSDLKGGNTPVAQLYEFKSIPQTLLINPEGRIVARNLDQQELLTLLKQIFKK